MEIKKKITMDSTDYELKVLNPYCCDVKFLKENMKINSTLYSISKESAIRIITSRRVNKVLFDTTLEEFLKSWKEEFKIVSKEVNELFFKANQS